MHSRCHMHNILPSPHRTASSRSLERHWLPGGQGPGLGQTYTSASIHFVVTLNSICVFATGVEPPRNQCCASCTTTKAEPWREDGKHAFSVPYAQHTSLSPQDRVLAITREALAAGWARSGLRPDIYLGQYPLRGDLEFNMRVRHRSRTASKPMLCLMHYHKSRTLAGGWKACILGAICTTYFPLPTGPRPRDH